MFAQVKLAKDEAISNRWAQRLFEDSTAHFHSHHPKVQTQAVSTHDQHAYPQEQWAFLLRKAEQHRQFWVRLLAIQEAPFSPRPVARSAQARASHQIFRR